MEQEARKLVLIYPVKDVAAAKRVFSTLLGVQPYADWPQYVGFRVGPIEVGLAPDGHAKGMSGSVAYFPADDIRKHLKELLDAGAVAGQDVTDVGGGGLIATVRDADGNVLGLVQ